MPRRNRNGGPRPNAAFAKLRDRGLNPRALGTNPRALGTNPRATRTHAPTTADREPPASASDDAELRASADRDGRAPSADSTTPAAGAARPRSDLPPSPPAVRRGTVRRSPDG